LSENGVQQKPPSLWLVLALPVSLVITVFALGFGLLYAVELDRGGGETAATETQPSGNAAGEAAFTSAGCAGCHTLSAAGATGTVGPNLDATQLTQDEIAATITNGRSGTAMQSYKGTLTPEQISAVAAYVSASGGSSP
jgi:mono/diheme cytochrome c family protein